MACPTFLYCNKTWTKKNSKKARRNETVGMEFSRSVKQFTKLDDVNVKIYGKN
jgi:hypothetical protein